jgi:hypothetical protein
MNWFNINRNISIHGGTNNFSVDRCRYGASISRITPLPTDKGYIKIYSTATAFAALKADGSITAWGDSTYGGTIPASINAKVVSYTMNGDISVDIEPIHTHRL